MIHSVIQILITITVLALYSVPAESILWSCAINVTGRPFDVDKISGEWYEVVRLPAVEVPACVIATAPQSTEVADNYNLQVEYRNNVNKRWQYTQENLTFPWDNDTQNGIFKLTYGEPESPIKISFIYKIVAVEYDSYAVVCGYPSISSMYSFVKIMSRERGVSDDEMKFIQLLANKYGMGAGLTWVDQSSRCSGAAKALPLLTIFIAVVYSFLVYKI